MTLPPAVSLSTPVGGALPSILYTCLRSTCRVPQGQRRYGYYVFFMPNCARRYMNTSNGRIIFADNPKISSTPLLSVCRAHSAPQSRQPSRDQALRALASILLEALNPTRVIAIGVKSWITCTEIQLLRQQESSRYEDRAEAVPRRSLHPRPALVERQTTPPILRGCPWDQQAATLPTSMKE